MTHNFCYFYNVIKIELVKFSKYVCFFFVLFTLPFDIYSLAKVRNGELLEYFSAEICTCLAARYVAGSLAINFLLSKQI